MFELSGVKDVVLSNASDMKTQLLTDYNQFVPADGIFSTLKRGGQNIIKRWDSVGLFLGSICVIAGIFYVVRGVMASQQRAKFFLMGAVGLIVGSILVTAGLINLIQGNFKDTWGEVFGN